MIVPVTVLGVAGLPMHIDRTMPGATRSGWHLALAAVSCRDSHATGWCGAAPRAGPVPRIHVGYGLLVLGVGLLGQAAVPEAPPPAPAPLRVQGRASVDADTIGRGRIVLALRSFLPLAAPQ